MKKRSEIGDSLREITAVLNDLARQFDELGSLSEECVKEAVSFVKRNSSKERIAISQEDYENLAVLFNKFKLALEVAPEPIRSIMKFSYYLGVMNGMVKSKGIIV